MQNYLGSAQFNLFPFYFYLDFFTYCDKYLHKNQGFKDGCNKPLSFKILI